MADYKNELKVIQTEDNSNSVYHTALDETYHSIHGALQESNHVFIKNGFDLMLKTEIKILEVGLGTGLNAALTAQAALKNNITTAYTALEPFPLTPLLMEEVVNGFSSELGNLMVLLTQSPPEISVKVNNMFWFTQHLNTIQTFNSDIKFDLIYFDAFAPDKQPEMWTTEIFSKLFQRLNSGGILSTYCAKGSVKRMLKQVGFEVKLLEGPPGKREMIYAYKS